MRFLIMLWEKLTGFRAKNKDDYTEVQTNNDDEEDTSVASILFDVENESHELKPPH